MPSFTVKSRTTGPLTKTTVDAINREGAIDQIIKGLGPDETVEVLQVDENDAAAVNPTVNVKR